MPSRDPLLGHPHCYAVEIESAQALPILDRLGSDLPRILEQVRSVFEARLYAWSATATRLRIVLQHVDRVGGDDAWLRDRWVKAGGIPGIKAEQLRRRLTSLAGFMQTLLQRLSRCHNAGRDQRGSVWARRYRACLLGDDDAVLAATLCCERRRDAPLLQSSAGAVAAAPPVRLAPPPIRLGPDGQWFHAEDGTPGLLPPPDDERPLWLARIAGEFSEDLERYDQALAHGWALGRSESLTGALQRLGRDEGRGRSRKLRDLGDRVGLVGLWG